MLTVTGYVKNEDSYLKDPFIRLAIHIEADDTINAEAVVYAGAAITSRVLCTIPFKNLAKSLLNNASGNGADSVRSKLETALRTLILTNNAGTTVVIS